MYYFKKKWAENGDVTQIPLEAQTDNSVSYEEGWTEEYELNPEEDVNAQILSRTNFNGLFSNITTVLQQLQKFGVNPFISSDDNGGTAFAYPLGGMCSYTDTSTNEYGIYYSLSANNTDAPSTGGVVSSNWWRIDKTPEEIAAIQEKLWFRNIGEIVTSTIPLTDSSLHLLDGSLLSNSGIYADFVNYIADLYSDDSSASYFTTEANWQASIASYGACGKFVYDSVNKTVRLPKIVGFIEGGTTSNVGEMITAGLPNITGTFYAWNGNYSGAFTGGTLQLANAGQTAYQASFVNFNASLSNSIYGNSSTVQPQAIQVLYYIVVGRSSTQTSIQSSKPYITETYSNGSSWYRLYSDGWCEQGGLITAQSAATSLTVTFLQPFVDTSYIVSRSMLCSSSVSGSFDIRDLQFSAKTTQSFTANVAAGTDITSTMWIARGYIS